MTDEEIRLLCVDFNGNSLDIRAERTCHLRKVIKRVRDNNGVAFHDELWDECSECGGVTPVWPNYCPNCGAKVISDGA